MNDVKKVSEGYLDELEQFANNEYDLNKVFDRNNLIQLPYEDVVGSFQM